MENLTRRELSQNQREQGQNIREEEQITYAGKQDNQQNKEIGILIGTVKSLSDNFNDFKKEQKSCTQSITDKFDNFVGSYNGDKNIQKMYMDETYLKKSEFDLFFETNLKAPLDLFTKTKNKLASIGLGLIVVFILIGIGIKVSWDKIITGIFK